MGDADGTPLRPLCDPDRVSGRDRYGDIAIVERSGGLEIRFTKTPALVGPLEHWQHDTFVARWTARDLRADAYVTFALNPDGSIDQVKLRAVSPETDFSFDFQDLLLRRKP